MNARTQPVTGPSTPMSPEQAARKWLDALASGRCTPEAFLREMREFFQADHEGSWEVLSLLDQYYRRGKIKAEVFHVIKNRLEGSALGAVDRATESAMPKASTIVTSPVATPEPPAAAKTASGSSLGRNVTTGDLLRGRYRIQEVLGRGGMGTVFGAIDEFRLSLPDAGQRLAIKVLHTAVTAREDLLAELQREFQHLQLLSHPNIVRVHEFDRDGDIAFFTMEAVYGALLGRVLSARNALILPRAYALSIIRDVGAALGHAHSRGVVHGDINPQNIFLTNDGEIRVLDFGASHKLRESQWNANSELMERPAVATPGYASCQQLEGQNPDARDDVFAFACVAYLLLSGAHPFPLQTALEARTRRSKAPRPRGITGQQWRVLKEGLQFDRERRPHDIREWLERLSLHGAAPRLPLLQSLLRTPPPRERQFMLATIALAIAAAAAAGYWAITDYDSMALSAARWTHETRIGLTAVGEFISQQFDKIALEPGAAPDTVSSSTAPAPAPAAPAARAAATQPSASTPPARTAAVPVKPIPALNAAPLPRAVAYPPPAVAATPAAAAVHGGSSWPARVELIADTVDVPSGETTARVTVRRKGNPHAAASFSWWTESGTAQPGVDFAAATPRLAQIDNGSSSVTLNIRVSDSRRSPPKSFYVVIDATEGGAEMGPRTLTMVTLLPPE